VVQPDEQPLTSLTENDSIGLPASANRVYLIRHGETDWNTSGRWQGILPISLNDTGRQQAQKLAVYLSRSGVAIDTLYTSDLPRAYETASIIGAMIGKVPITDERLRELNVGVFQGLARPEIEAQYPDSYSSFLANPLEYIIPGGESRRQLQERAYSAWTEFTNADVVKHIGIVTHSGTIKMLLSHIFRDVQVFENEHIENTSITVLSRLVNGWHLDMFAQRPHFFEYDAKSKNDTTIADSFY
jgi:broad specificity phosphatase PhoE